MDAIKFVVSRGGERIGLDDYLAEKPSEESAAIAEAVRVGTAVDKYGFVNIGYYLKGHYVAVVADKDAVTYGAALPDKSHLSLHIRRGTRSMLARQQAVARFHAVFSTAWESANGTVS